MCAYVPGSLLCFSAVKCFTSSQQLFMGHLCVRNCTVLSEDRGGPSSPSLCPRGLLSVGWGQRFRDVPTLSTNSKLWSWEACFLMTPACSNLSDSLLRSVLRIRNWRTMNRQVNQPPGPLVFCLLRRLLVIVGIFEHLSLQAVPFVVRVLPDEKLHN